MDVTVKHDEERHRFVAETSGACAYLEYAEEGDARLVFRHTYVPKALRGEGIGGQIVAAGLRYARDHGRKVVAACPFVRTFVDRNPAYADVLV